VYSIAEKILLLLVRVRVILGNYHLMQQNSWILIGLIADRRFIQLAFVLRFRVFIVFLY